jgi:hypothetical protein
VASIRLEMDSCHFEMVRMYNSLRELRAFGVSELRLAIVVLIAMHTYHSRR